MDILNMNLWLDNTDDFDVLTLEARNRKFTKTQCKCGHSEFGVFDTCPKCGNHKKKNLAFYFYNGGTLDSIFIGSKNKDIFEFFCSGIKTYAKGNDIELLIDNNLTFSIAGVGSKGDTGTTFGNGYYSSGCLKYKEEALKSLTYNRYGYSDFNKNYQNAFENFKNTSLYDKEFEDYKHLFEDSLCEYTKYKLIQECCPMILDKNKNYISLVPLLLANASLTNIFKRASTMEDFIKKAKLEDYKAIIQNKKVFDAIPDSYGLVNNSTREILLYFSTHYLYPITKVYGIYKDCVNIMNNGLLSEDLLDYFLTKNILIIRGENLYENVKKIVDFLNSNHKAVNKTNIDNYTTLISMSSLKNKGFKDKKISLFFDSFIDNPLQAMELLASKKDFTKKELDDFLEKLANN